MSRLPILSIMTWAPFLSALVIMFAARQRPLLVRWTSVVGTGISLVASLWVYCEYDRTAAGFQFHEQLPLVPSLGISYLLAIDGISAADQMVFHGNFTMPWLVIGAGELQIVGLARIIDAGRNH